MHEERDRRRDEFLLAVLASAASIAAFLHYYRQHEILLYGDAVAHINIARRVFDSITPGPLQLGTVWLPLPHLLMIPFVISNWMWRTGVGGSVVSMIAYVAGTVGVYRLTKIAVSSSERGCTQSSRVPHFSRRLGEAGIFAALIYAANPNLLYIQATAMSESLYLALFIWTVIFAIELLQAPEPATAKKKLEGCGLCVAGAMLTRYDGWFLAVCVLVIVVAVWLVAGRGDRCAGNEAAQPRRVQTRCVVSFAVLTLAIAGLWLAYNDREFGNPAEFATGPYSARAIERRTETSNSPHHPGYHSPLVATEYFLKAAKLNVGGGRWELPLIVAAAVGVLAMLATRSLSAALLLWAPLPFYALSVACGGVPIFLPVWWPFSYYNVRYGLELLPAIAVCAACALVVVGRYVSSRTRIFLVFVFVVIVAGSYASVWRTTPICLREAHANGDVRQRFEMALAHALERLPASSRLLMSTGDHPGALERAGFPLRRVVNETNHPQWEQALSAPAQHADYFVALDNDDVAQAVAAHPKELVPTATVSVPNASRTTIYKSLLRERR